MVLSSGLICCKKQHDHEIIVVNAYRNDLYLAWSIEVLKRLSETSAVRITSLDLSSGCVDSQISGISSVAKFLQKRIHSKLIRRLFLKYSDEHFTAKRSLFNLRFKEAFFLIRKVILYRNFRLLSVESKDSSKWKAVHSTFATECGSVEYPIFRNLLRLSKLATSHHQARKLVESRLASASYCQLIVGNSRLVNSAGTMDAARMAGVATLVVERGARPGMIDTYRISPHSMLERRQHALSHWSRGDTELVELRAKNYIELRKEFEPISGVRWSRQMEHGYIPNIPKDKKLCVFFTSSEIEFAVFGDAVNPLDFQSQSDAAAELIAELNSDEWVIIIRRHPYGMRKFKKDPEKNLWQKFVNSSNVLIVSPDSKIDSYALADRADLVAHFNSSIGPEVISRLITPVITMGPTMWEDPGSKYCCTSVNKLRAFLAEPLKVRNYSDALLWGYYWDSFGDKFEVVDWVPPRGFIDGRRILPNIFNPVGWL
jgi:hypothetical protein